MEKTGRFLLVNSLVKSQGLGETALAMNGVTSSPAFSGTSSQSLLSVLPLSSHNSLGVR